MGTHLAQPRWVYMGSTPNQGMDGDTTPEIDGIDTLISQIDEAGDSVEKWSHILKDYITFGNNKVSKNTAIFNFNAASDCPNRESKNCQVPWEACYAGKAERIYPAALPYRRRQEYLWDCITPELFAEAFLAMVSRKRNPVKSLRFSEAGDFRHNGDVVRAEIISARLAEEGIKTYTYSASDYLNWSPAKTLTVNQSNDFSEYGDRRFMAVPSADKAPEGAVQCPFDYAEKNGVPTADRPKCGDCQLCVTKDAGDVFVTLH